MTADACFLGVCGIRQLKYELIVKVYHADEFK